MLHFLLFFKKFQGCVYCLIFGFQGSLLFGATFKVYHIQFKSVNRYMRIF